MPDKRAHRACGIDPKTLVRFSVRALATAVQANHSSVIPIHTREMSIAKEA